MGGLVVLGGWLPIRDEIKRLASQHLRCRSSWGMADDDSIVPCRLARMSLGVVFQEKVGEPGLKFKEYPGLQHSSSEQELEDVMQFLRHVIPESQ
ncbi:hypothetical protein EDC04DRAFT_2717385 [Pisolithus marmoratus]|nr:hypothetical protein EDC04DRAFT_2717385 [Pisolithus marmoratus]